MWGAIGGSGSYGFLLTAIDGQAAGGGGTDRFRIKIWGSNGVIYDNQMGAAGGPVTELAAQPLPASGSFLHSRIVPEK